VITHATKDMAGRDVYYSDGIIRFPDFKDSMSGRLYPGVVKQFVVERDAWRGVFFFVLIFQKRAPSQGRDSMAPALRKMDFC
jgi:hypothetical protein